MNELLATLAATLRRRLAELRPADGLIGITVATPGLTLHQPATPPTPYLYWARPREERFLLGVGEAWSAETAGAGRFARLKEAAALPWHHLDADAGGLRPLLFLGAAFADDDPMTGPWAGLPNSRLTLPALLLQRHGARRGITFSATAAALRQPEALLARWLDLARHTLARLAEPPAAGPCPMPLRREEAQPADERWRERVAAATAAIAAGEVEKVVVTRRLAVTAPRPFDPMQLMAALACMYPGCVLYAGRAIAGPTVVAATPERLAVRRGDAVESDALAGTCGRAPAPAEDGALAAALLADPKSRREHALVAAAVAAALAPFCRELEPAGEPRLLKLRTLQHLWTPLRGRLAPGHHLLDLAAALHPTPAVGGAPRDAAAQWLQRHGEGERGWYTGVVGWLDREGDGELSVLLRCALLQEERAHLFAGSGIVADSVPAAELEESEWKLAALLGALENG